MDDNNTQNTFESVTEKKSISQMFSLKKFSDYFKGDKSRRLIIFLGIAGIALIFLSTFIGGSDDSKRKTQSIHNEISSAQYEQQLEQRLRQIISQINGVGDVQVMITLENGVRYVYATDNSIETQTEYGETIEIPNEQYKEENNIVMVDSANGKQALVTTQVEPAVKGVVIVCEGGDISSVKQRVIEAATTALDISSGKVCVVASK